MFHCDPLPKLRYLRIGCGQSFQKTISSTITPPDSLRFQTSYGGIYDTLGSTDWSDKADFWITRRELI